MQMPEKTFKNSILRNYLLNRIESETEMEEIELRLMTDNSFFRQLEFEEADLIQNYADGELDSAERAAFEKNLLHSAGVQEKVKFARALRKYVIEQTAAQSKEAAVNDEQSRKLLSRKPAGGWFWRPLPLVFGSLALLVVAAFAFWNFFIRASETDRAVASLNNAYKSERPLQSRVTSLTYAPFRNLRGANDENIDLIERNRAERILLDEVAENLIAENLHALGRLYLVKKDFEQAVTQLEKAKNIMPRDAGILNDLGTAYLEKSKMISGDEEGRIKTVAGALEMFEESLRFNPLSPEARFNKALTLEMLNLPGQAENAWKEYLELDSDSPWAEEARKNLQHIESQKQQSK
jgi:tetratricopeptide (TPR) repeat protein